MSTIERTDDRHRWWIPYLVAVGFVATTAASVAFQPRQAPTSSLDAVSTHYVASAIYSRSETALGMLEVGREREGGLCSFEQQVVVVRKYAGAKHAHVRLRQENGRLDRGDAGELENVDRINRPFEPPKPPGATKAL